MNWAYNSGATIFTTEDGREGWYYPADDGTWRFTEGMPSRPFMYETAQYLRERSTKNSKRKYSRMVKDNVNLYFTNLLKDLQKQYNSLKGGQVYKLHHRHSLYVFQTDRRETECYPHFQIQRTVSILDWKSKFYSNKSASELREVSKFRKGIYGRDWISL